ncbi:hypothetical protein ACOJCM_02130 [Billgrantia sp. LNSP4103-1]|uniref:hypothetical protein n=1 Tax=Billgrantia sp. LNSP4103-1 TaxID=3410266 RepID=UPI00403F8FC9
MNAERSQLYYSCVFLHVSFQAVHASVARSTSADNTPCWLDASMLQMLLGELQRCRWEAAPFKNVCQSLDTALYHCSLLMAQCPAALNRQLCQHHLEAVIAPLKETTALLANNGKDISSHHVSSPARRLRTWLGL